jgi:hypothetical protein
MILIIEQSYLVKSKWIFSECSLKILKFLVNINWIISFLDIPTYI